MLLQSPHPRLLLLAEEEKDGRDAMHSAHIITRFSGCARVAFIDQSFMDLYPTLGGLLLEARLVMHLRDVVGNARYTMDPPPLANAAWCATVCVIGWFASVVFLLACWLVFFFGSLL